MNRLLKEARSAAPSTGVQFRKSAYGAHGLRRFLRDVLAMANAAVSGSRLIFTGIDVDETGNRRVHAIPEEDFAGKPCYQSLVADYIEPPLRVRYQPISFEGCRVGVYEITGCADKPYMMRIDHSEQLRRGDAYVRVDNSVVKMGRRQLQNLFEARFEESVSADNIEVGFAGEIMHKTLQVDTVDLSRMPSAQVGAKLKQLLEMRSKLADSGSATVMARLTHARLFGSDRPYEDQSPEELMQEMADIRKKHRHEDEYFLYEANGQELQLMILNQGRDTIENAALSLVMPNHNSLYVAGRLPHLPKNDRWIARPPTESSGYPAVSLKDDSVHVSITLGDIATDAPVRVFETPLRICVGSELKGRRLQVRYTLFGSNLRRPAKGSLKLVF